MRAQTKIPATGLESAKTTGSSPPAPRVAARQTTNARLPTHATAPGPVWATTPAPAHPVAPRRMRAQTRTPAMVPGLAKTMGSVRAAQPVGMPRIQRAPTLTPVTPPDPACQTTPALARSATIALPGRGVARRALRGRAKTPPPRAPRTWIAGPRLAVRALATWHAFRRCPPARRA